MKKKLKVEFKYMVTSDLKAYESNPRINDEAIEPVIDPIQSLVLIRATLPFVDQYKLGKWNHDPRADDIDWKQYGAEAVEILRSNGKQFYVKEDLQPYISGLTEQETDMDYMSLKMQPKENKQLTMF